MSRSAQNGDTVKIHYSGRLTSGEEFDSSAERDPLQFIIGSGQVIPGFENGVIGMSVGDKKTLNISPEDAYGEVNESLVFQMPRDNVPDEITPEVGMGLQLQNEGGEVIRVVVTGVEDDSITLDANHPLAGQELVFDVDMVEIM